MIYKVGQRVAFIRSDAVISDHAIMAFGIDFIYKIKFGDCKFFNGEVTKIKTHIFWIFKRKDPLFLIDDYYLVKSIKPIITMKAVMGDEV